MKSIQTHINERLKLNRDRVQHYEYFPETKNELRNIIENLIDKKGNNVDLNIIDTSKITDMSKLFDDYFLNDFCGDVSQWNVSNVKEMNSMFFNCKHFNCDLSHWDVSQVEDMGFMFGGCTSFTGDGLKQWNVSKVKNMEAMFAKCKNLDCDLSHWDVSQVTNMQHMFYDSNFNNDISSWKIKNNTTTSAAYAPTSEMFSKSPLENNPPAWYKNI